MMVMMTLMMNQRQRAGISIARCLTHMYTREYTHPHTFIIYMHASMSLFVCSYRTHTPTHDQMRVHIKVAGDWTRQLEKTLCPATRPSYDAQEVRCDM